MPVLIIHLQIKYMKPLDNLINVEKAKLLHELFPQEIPLYWSTLTICVLLFRRTNN